MSLGKSLDHFERIGKLGRETDAVGSADDRIFPEARRSRDIARFEKVVAHQVLSGFAAFRVAITQLSRNLFLKFKCKDVGVPSGIEVKKVTKAMQELERILRNRMAVARLETLAHPARPMYVAEPAGSFFDVGFQLINRVAELFISSQLHIGQPLQKPVAVFLNETRHQLEFEFQGGRRIAQK